MQYNALQLEVCVYSIFATRPALEAHNR